MLLPVTLFLAIVLCLGHSNFQVLAQDNDNGSDNHGIQAETYYPIPDPFEAGANNESYYMIKSFQCIVSSQKKKTQTEVVEYFSLKYGLSYSLHRNRDDRSQAFALIGDGPRSRSYVVRNPEADNKQTVDCELDHAHHHRQVFPWQYVYEASDGEKGDELGKAKKKKKRKDKSRWSGKRFIYGVGAVWLNAIKRQVISREVGDQSPLPGSNLWHMREPELEVELLFDKPEVADDKQPDADEMRRLVGQSTLDSIHIKRLNALEQDPELEGSVSEAGESMDMVTVRELKPNVNISDEILGRFFYQLAECRRQTKLHRVFPSLMRAVSLSPERMFAIEYVQRKVDLPLVKVTGNQEEDPAHHRIVRDSELVTEWFSFKLEAQATVYEPAPPSSQLEDPLHPDYVTDVFLSRFTERETGRTGGHSRHSTVHYHIIERGGNATECRVGESDPLPSWNQLMMRQVHFRRADGRRFTGLLSGLGALLMNAAEIHYKQFSLFEREISALYDAANLSARRPTKVNEWQLEDKKTGRTLHFYFDAKSSGSGSHSGDRDISGLTRVDVRDSPKEKEGDDVAISGAGDEQDETGLLVRFDVISLATDRHPDECQFMLTAPKECGGSDSDFRADEPDTSDEDASDGDFNEGGNDDEQSNFFGSDQEDNGDESGDDDNEEHDDQNEQTEGQDFEFEPGNLEEKFPFPDFFDFFEGRVAYNIVSSLQLVSEEEGEQDEGSRRSLQLVELVDMDAGLAKLSVYPTRAGSRLTSEPSLEFYANYDSELMFRREIKRKSPEQSAPLDTCRLIDELDPWLRLLSARLDYYKRPSAKLHGDNEPALIRGGKLPLIGLGALWRRASLSEETYFMGASKKSPSVRLADGSEYRQLSWGMVDDSDYDLRFQFRFLWNSSQFNLDSAKQKRRRPTELLSLHSLRIVADPNFEVMGLDIDRENKFRSVEFAAPIQVNDLRGGVVGQNMLPKSCANALQSLSTVKFGQDLEKEEESSGKMPSFWDFIRPSNSYSARYIVSHAPELEPATGGQQPPAKNKNPTATRVSATQLSESFDRNKKLGRITTGNGPETRQVYIDANKRTIYSYMESAGVCKPLGHLSGLMDTSSSFERENTDFNLDDMYGLANLWIQLSRSLNRSFLQRVSFRHDDQGNEFEMRTYRSVGEVHASISDRINFAISASFVARNKGQFRLDSLIFVPSYGDSSRSSKVPLHRTLIQVQELKPEASLDWQLPDECLKLEPNPDSDPNSSGEQPQSQVEFPKLSSLIQARQQFYMRSELSSSQLELGGGEQKKLFIMDEWLYKGDMRLKTYGLSRNFDLLIYGPSRETFDLSVQSKCLTGLPKLEPERPKRHPSSGSLLDFWSGQSSSVEELSELFYGPVALWRLAELNLGQVKLISSMDLAPLPQVSSSRGSRVDRLEREMREEVWRVTGPQLEGKFTWSYDMTFEQMSDSEVKTTESDAQWHVLNGINVIEAATSGQRQVEIDVLNYRYQQPEEELNRRFLLPEGRGCTRSPEVIEQMRRAGDDLKLDWSLDHSFWYEASMELFSGSTADDDLDKSQGSKRDTSDVTSNLQTGRVLPTLTGTLVKSSWYLTEPPVDVYAHYQQTHYQNGTTSSTKMIYDRPSGLVFEMDLKSGQCQIGQLLRYPTDWSLRFPMPKNRDGDDEIKLTMDSKMMEVLFKQTKEFYVPLNRYSVGDQQFSVYEHSLLHLPQNEKRNPQSMGVRFQGPVSVTRTFQNHVNEPLERTDTGSSSPIRRHSSVRVKVLVSDSATGQRPLAKLSLTLRALRNTELAESIGHFSAADCYSKIADHPPLTRSFVIEYQCSAETERQTRGSLRSSTINEFTMRLLRNARLLPSQLDGSPRLEIGNRKLRFHFRLLEAPTAVEYASRKFVGSRLSLELESRSEMRLTSSLSECSNWCEQVSCVAMSYCFDRTCRLVTLGLLKGQPASNETSAGLTPQDLAKLFVSVPDADCSYYLWTSTQPRSLSQFADSMDSLINERRDEKELEKFSVTLFGRYYEHVAPIGFHELKSQFEQIDEDSIEGTDPQVIYKTQWLNHMLEPTKLENLGKKGGDGFSGIRVEWSDNYASCMDICIKSKCPIVSYCKSTQICLLVEGMGDLRDLEPALSPRPYEYGCSIMVRDFISSYTEFKGTMAPASSEIQLDNYSADHCAALCDTYQGPRAKFNCLSFDFCTNEESNSTTSCYLQKSHVMLDSFDRLILEPKWEQAADSSGNSSARNSTCNHYSKSVLADFERLPNKRLDRSRDIAPGEVIRGSPPERCAVDCRQDDQCLAFEYCFDDKLQPVQSCYIIRALNAQLEAHRLNYQEDLVHSDKCSIYRLIHERETYNLDRTLGTSVFQDLAAEAVRNGPLNYCILAACYIMLSIALGSLIQFVYIKLFGRPITISNH